MAAIAFALSSSLLWGLSDYAGGFKSRTYAVPVVLAAMYLSSLLVMLVFVGARGEGPPSSSYVLAGLGAGIVGIMALGAFYTALSIGTMSIVAPISATGVALPVIVGLIGGDEPGAVRSAGLAARGRRDRARLARGARRADRPARAAAEHRPGDPRRPRLRLVLRARRDRLGGRRRLDAAALARRGLSDRRAHRAAGAAPRRRRPAEPARGGRRSAASACSTSAPTPPTTTPRRSASCRASPSRARCTRS